MGSEVARESTSDPMPSDPDQKNRITPTPDREDQVPLVEVAALLEFRVF